MTISNADVTETCSLKRVSVIIVNFNGKQFLEKLLYSLANQTYKDFEIIFIDNNSQDGSMSFLSSLLEKDKCKCLYMKTVSNKTNLGFCKGNNQGLKYAQGEYVVLLNNDTDVSSRWLEALVEAMDRFPDLGACQSKIILTVANKPHYGLMLDRYGQSHVLENLEHVSSENNLLVDQFFYPSGASVILRKDVLDQCGFFDELLFFGDYDLAWKLRIYGFKLATSLNSICYHHKGFTTGYATRSLYSMVDSHYHSYKERIRVLVKYYSFSNVVKTLPVATFLMALDSLYASLTCKKPLVHGLLRAVFWNIKNLKESITQRSIIQQNRVISDDKLSCVTFPRSFFVISIKNRFSSVFVPQAIITQVFDSL